MTVPGITKQLKLSKCSALLRVLACICLASAWEHTTSFVLIFLNCSILALAVHFVLCQTLLAHDNVSNRRLQCHRILESDIVPGSAVRMRVASGANPRVPWAEAATRKSSGASGGNAGASSQSQAIGIPVFLPQVVNVEPPKSPAKEQGKGDDEDDEESDSGSGSADGEGEEDDEEEGEEGDGEEGEESEDEEEEEEAMVEG